MKAVRFAGGVILLALAGASSRARFQSVERPPILCVAHIGLFTNDIDAATKFYGDELGYQHFSLDKPSGGLMLNYYKVNDHQYIEVFPDLKSETQDRLSHIAFETTNIQQLRDYLDSKGVKVPATLKTGIDGNVSMMIKDPDGHNVEFVQYMQGSLHSRNFGKYMDDRRVSTHMIHVGVTVADQAAADKFYKDILGFRSIWQGGRNGETDWVDMCVPDGSDWLEYMLNVHNPTPKSLGVQHHLALGVAKIQPAYQEVLSRGAKPPQPPKLGMDGKWQLNMYDPNYTRVEYMEFKPEETPCCSPMLAPNVAREY